MGPPAVKVDLSIQPDLGKFSQARQPCLLGNPYNLSRWKSVLTITRTNMKQPCLCVKKPLFSKLKKEIIWWKSTDLRGTQSLDHWVLCGNGGSETRMPTLLSTAHTCFRKHVSSCHTKALQGQRPETSSPQHLIPGYVLHALPEQVSCLHSPLRGPLTCLCPPHLSKLRSPLVTFLSKLPVPYPLKLGVEIQSISNLLSSHLKINTSTYHVPGSG